MDRLDGPLGDSLYTVYARLIDRLPLEISVNMSQAGIQEA
jgi:hypothetical protein